MNKAIALSAAMLMAACNATDNNEAETPAATETVAANGDAGFEAVAPGNYEIVRASGEIDELTVHPGLTWSMVAHDGSASGGTIFAQGGKNCFVTEGVDGHRCFAGGAPAEDGSMEVTGDDGEIATVRPVDGFGDTPEI